MFTHSLNVKQFYSTHWRDLIRGYLSRSEWPWEQWQWMVTPYSPKFQHYLRFTIGLFNVVSRTLVWGGVLPPPVEMQLVYSTTQLTGWVDIWVHVSFEDCIFFKYMKLIVMRLAWRSENHESNNSQNSNCTATNFLSHKQTKLDGQDMQSPEGEARTNSKATFSYRLLHVDVSMLADQQNLTYISSARRCPWCNCYRRRKWTRRHEFKSWTRLIAFHIALIPLGKVWIQLFSLQQWVNSRTD